MTESDDMLSRWSDDWQEADEPLAEDASPIRRRHLVLLARNVAMTIASVLAVVVAGLFLWADVNVASFALFAVVAAVVGADLYQSWRLLAQLRASMRDTTRGFVETSVAALRRQRDYHRRGLKQLPAVAVAVIAAAGLVVWQNISVYQEEPWRAVVGLVGVGVLLALAYGLGRYNLRRSEEQLACLEELDESL